MGVNHIDEHVRENICLRQEIRRLQDKLKEAKEHNGNQVKTINGLIESECSIAAKLAKAREKIATYKELGQKSAKMVITIVGLQAEVDRLKEIGEKYSKATEWYDELIKNRFVKMSFPTQKLVNQIGKEILEALSPESTGLNKTQWDLLTALEKLWSTHPTERFGQLLYNHMLRPIAGPGVIQDIFYYLDEDVLSDLRR